MSTLTDRSAPAATPRRRAAYATGVLLALAGTAVAFFLATSSADAEVTGGAAVLQLDVSMTNRPLFPVADGTGGSWQWGDLTGREAEASSGTLVVRNTGDAPLEAALTAVTGLDDYSTSPYEPGEIAGYEQVDHLVAVLCPHAADRISSACSVTPLATLPRSAIGFGRVEAAGDTNDVQRRRVWVFLAESGREQPSAVLTDLTWAVEGRTP